MPSIRRVPFTKPIPPGAEFFTKRGKRFVRFINGRGRSVQGPASADGKRVQLLSRKYYGTYRDADGTEKTVPLCADELAAQQMLAEIVRRAERERTGLVDPVESEEFRKRLLLCPACRSKGATPAGEPCPCPTSPHLTGYRLTLEARNNHPRYVSQAVAHCADIVEGIEARQARDLDADKVDQWLAEQRRHHGMSVSTSNHYLTSAKGFAKWLAKRLGRNPLVHLTRLNAEPDIRRVRRALELDELHRLLRAAQASKKVHRGLAGVDRLMLYALAMVTGYRAGELAGLEPSSFILDSEHPGVRCRAGYVKNRKEALQPLPLDLAAALRDYLQDRPAGPVWPGTWHAVGFKLIARDLAAARTAWIEEAKDDAKERRRREQSYYLAYEDGEGRTADFHALRHSYITHLVRSGVHPKLVQQLARHSSSALTDRYTHLPLVDLAGAVGALPAVLPAKQLEAAPADRLRSACAAHEETCAKTMTPDEMVTEQGSETGSPQVRGTRKDEDKRGRAKKGEQGVGDGTRTRDIQSHSLTL